MPTQKFSRVIYVPQSDYKSAVLIQDAEEKHLKEIVQIAKKCQLQDPPQEGGFLVTNFDRSSYLELLKYGSDVLFLVACDSEDRCIGFLVGYNERWASKISRKGSEASIFEFLGKNATFFVLKQIAVDPDCQRNGIGQILFQAGLKTIDRSCIFSAIVTKPRNLASEAFHQKTGFRPILKSHSQSMDGTYRTENQIWSRSVLTD